MSDSPNPAEQRIRELFKPSDGSAENRERALVRIKEAGRVRARRRKAVLLGVTTVLAVTVGALGMIVSLGTSEESDPQVLATDSPVADQQIDLSPVQEAPVEFRKRSLAVWTGEEYILWGGSSFDLYDDGMAYDPVAAEWRVLAPSPLTERRDPAAVWTGSTLFIWGGTDNQPRALAGAALYDPAADAWEEISEGPLGGQMPIGAEWTGEDILLVTRDDANGLRSALFDPSSRDWTELPDVPDELRFSRQGSSSLLRSEAGVVLATGDVAGARVGEWRRDSGWTLLPDPPTKGGNVLAWSGSLLSWDDEMMAALEPDGWAAFPSPAHLGSCIYDVMAMEAALVSVGCGHVSLFSRESEWQLVNNETFSYGAAIAGDQEIFLYLASPSGENFAATLAIG